MVKLIKQMLRNIRKSFSNKKKIVKKTHKRKGTNKHTGGSVYSFDLNDKVGGLPATVSLNGTGDGDCPSGNPSALGFDNYGIASGGKRSNRKKQKNNKKSHKSNKNNNNNNNNNKNSKSKKRTLQSRKH
jgi:hypothetical protein